MVLLSGKSTATNLLKTLNDWILAVRDKYAVNVVYIDYAKAFEKVYNAKLLSKLDTYGVTGNLRIKWIETFLTNRTRQTMVGCSFSENIKFTSGKIQGSVLGSLLFLLFINDIVYVKPVLQLQYN